MGAVGLSRHCMRSIQRFAFFGAVCALCSLFTATIPAAVAHSAPLPPATKQAHVTAAEIARSTPHLRPWSRITVPNALRPRPDLPQWASAPGRRVGTTTNTLATYNWSGVVDQGSTFTGASATWVVPNVTTPPDVVEVSSNWVGVDGFSNQSLIQTGTTEADLEGTGDYFAWVEILPAASTEEFPVNAGDEISASVAQDSPGVWTISIADVTLGLSYSTNPEVSYTGPGTSAEWIQEAPEDQYGDIYTLADFGTVQFSHEQVSGTTLDSVNATPMVMLDEEGFIIAFPGDFSGNGFTDTYGSQSFFTTTEATAAAEPVTVGASVTYSATVSAGGPFPTGTVSFIVGTTLLCTSGSLASGRGSCASTGAPVGNDVVTALYSGASTTYAASSGTTNVVVLNDPGSYVAMTPVRICDTRPGNPSGLSGAAAQCNGSGNSGEILPTGGVLTINVAGEFGVPASDVTAVVLNVTEVHGTGAGYFTLYPTGSLQPTASNLNFVSGQVVPNLVEVGVGASGQVSLFSSVSADAIADLEGYVTTATQGGAGLYNALSSPARICDTRGGNPSGLTGGATQCNPDTAPGSPDNLVGPSTPLTINVAGLGGLPATGVEAVVLNVTVTRATDPGYITAYPEGATPPTASNVNYGTGQTIANRVVVEVGSDTGQVTLFSAAPTDVIVDVSGYFTAAGGTGAEFTPGPAPVRICDTRGSNPSELVAPYTQCNTDSAPGSPSNPITANDTLEVQGAGLGNVPTGATAVVLNLTAVRPSASGYLTVYPQSPRPTTSDLNPPAGGVLANMVVATLTGSGTFDIYNAFGDTNVVVDVAGWYTTPE